MEVAAQIRQNSKEYSDFVSDLHKWTREAEVSSKEDELLFPVNKTKEKSKQEYYRKWEEFDVEKELENVDYTVEQDKTDDRYSRVKEALVRKELGNEYFKKGFYKKALSEYTGSLTLDWNEKTLGNRALVWLKLEMYDECIKDCSQLIEMDSKCTKGYWRRGVARFSLGDLIGARKDLELAIVLEPGNKSIREDLQKTRENVKQEKVRPERVRVEIQEIGVSNDDGEEQEPFKDTTAKKIKESAEESVKKNEITDLKILENHVQKLQVSDLEIMKPGCFMDFERDFKRFKKDKQVLYQYIKKLDANSFKSLFANYFQEEYLVSFVEILHDFYLLNQEYNEAMEVLKNLVLISRFNMVQMFLSKTVKQKISFIFETLSSRVDSKDLDPLKKEYKLN